MSRKEQLAKAASETVDIVNKGEYKVKNKVVNVKEQVENAVNNTILYSPEDGDKLLESFNNDVSYKTKFEATNETTLKAITRLKELGFENVVALNFASAKKPGGGFLTGSSAQEESLARASALYHCISPKKEMYNHNKSLTSGLYSDYMIYSPNVPIIKDDFGDLLETPQLSSFITSPAVNLTWLPQEDKPKVRQVMKQRIEKILAVALENGNDTIVLGAYGCGVFGNRPADVAQIFRQVLNSEKFKNKFKRVTFAVYDKTPRKEIFTVFKNSFGR